ncbi:MAG: hypothetical protein M5R40_17050 [Anaerolineae bacterium]|nr:hypothetical protein [Anaerolineae bacterium]
MRRAGRAYPARVMLPPGRHLQKSRGYDARRRRVQVNAIYAITARALALLCLTLPAFASGDERVRRSRCPGRKWGRRRRPLLVSADGARRRSRRPPAHGGVQTDHRAAA